LEGIEIATGTKCLTGPSYYQNTDIIVSSYIVDGLAHLFHEVIIESVSALGSVKGQAGDVFDRVFFEDYVLVIGHSCTGVRLEQGGL
jgi:hypothetical protein